MDFVGLTARRRVQKAGAVGLILVNNADEPFIPQAVIDGVQVQLQLTATGYAAHRAELCAYISTMHECVYVPAHLHIHMHSG